MFKKVILDRYLEYIKAKGIDIRKTGKVIVLECPKCKKEPHTATLIPNTHLFNCTPCKYKFTVIDLVKATEKDKKDYTEEQVLEYLQTFLKIEVPSPKEVDYQTKLFNFYQENKFDLVPVAKNNKFPVEKEWPKKHHTDIGEWKSWVDSGLNMGVKTGNMSNITVLDVDTADIPEELKPFLKDTLFQKTNKGWHFFFKYEPQLPKTRIDEWSLDIENDGGQVVIEPSVIDEVERKMSIAKISKMSDELLKLLLSKVTLPRKTHSEKIKEDIATGDFKIDYNAFQLINDNLNGCCNSEFIKLGGIIRKELNARSTAFVLKTLNKTMLENPMKDYTVERMVEQLDKYIQFDEQDLSHQIIEYLKITEGASKAEIEIAVLGKRATGEDKKRIDKCLVYLIKEEKINRKGRQYNLLQSMEWEESLVNVGKPINFEVPYVGEFANFNWGDLMILGSKNKNGKTTLAMNVVKKLVDQGVKPYYIYSESGGRFSKTALKLGMKDGDFKHIFCGKPEDIKIEPNSVVIYDWVRPSGGFNFTDELYDKMVQKLEKAKAFMICFVQLKHDDSWFAPNMITQYPALACKYLYQDQNEGTNTYFHITEVREPKVHGKQFKIPCRYDWDTKEVIKEEVKEGVAT